MDRKEITIGVLALQGAFREHIRSIRELGAEAIEVRLPEHMAHIDGLIIPGGESTTMDNLMERYGFKEILRQFADSGKPLFGTCAGMILLAKKTKDNLYGMGFIDIEVRRNAYGRQIDSFEKDIPLRFISPSSQGEDMMFHAVFIRAPRISSVGGGVEILSELDGEAILVRQDNILAGAFHPELTEDRRIHKYFLDMVISYKKEGEVRCQVIQNGIQ